MRLRTVSDLVTHPRPEDNTPSILELGEQLPREAQQQHPGLTRFYLERALSVTMLFAPALASPTT